MDILDLLLHPIRLRVVWAMSGGRTRTTADLCASLPDVPRTTIYRHVALLADAGVLEVVAEHRVRGVVERHYRLHRARAHIDATAGATMSLDDHRHAFAAAMAALLAEFNAYLTRPGVSPFADSVSYRQSTFWLTPDELAAMTADLHRVIATRATNPPTPDRRPHLLSTIFFPTDDD
ncbi:helix-turn-helix domain-containing protein [Actinokineospora inagensis]|uniref:helix-turn-helix domain-containing protein n=1 Tax=Actinokineospora inagensis TaxID=103730 RepID=UPI00042927E1|nr:helix-turn-helix domain-containing protein [Actinokineospora inagensis]